MTPNDAAGATETGAHSLDAPADTQGAHKASQAEDRPPRTQTEIDGFLL